MYQDVPMTQLERTDLLIDFGGMISNVARIGNEIYVVNNFQTMLEVFEFKAFRPLTSFTPTRPHQSEA